VVTPDCFVETADGSSLYPTEGYCLKQDSGYGADIGANIGGTFFSGAFIPQKWDIFPPFYPLFKLFQRHVSFYILKMSQGCFVWAAPPLVLAPTIFIIALFS
jgi:hypothetical protein